MAACGVGTINLTKAAPRKAIKEDLYNIYEITVSAQGIRGQVYVPKAAANQDVDDTVTLTIAAPEADRNVLPAVP